MSEPLSPELEQKAQELAARIRMRSEESILAMARRLVASTDATLFGDTEFALRDQALGLVAEAYAEHLPQKVGTTGRPSTAPSAAGRPRSTGTGRRRSRPSGGRSLAAEPTTTAGCAGKDSARGTPGSD